MFRVFKYTAIYFFVVHSQAYAGDTVTVNIPGGATQIVSASTIAASINSSSGAGIVISSGEISSSVSSISQDISAGLVTVISKGGRVYVVSSDFIGTVFDYYK